MPATTKKLNSKHRDLVRGRKLAHDPSRMIEWFGGVDYDNLERVFGDLKRLVKIDATKEVQLFVNSYGGPTGIGMSFYDTARSWKGLKLITIGTGDVDSSGILVFLAGKRRYLTKNTTLLLHMAGRTFSEGKRYTVHEMESMIKEDKLKDYQYACVVADATRGKYTVEKVLELMQNSTTLTAEEAVNMGLAHGIVS